MTLLHMHLFWSSGGPLSFCNLSLSHILTHLVYLCDFDKLLIMLLSHFVSSKSSKSIKWKK